jgi:carboxypeptidase C (cathepsin A)
MDGLVLQSPAMDYNSNCGVAAAPTISCAAYLPSYAAVGAWHQLTQPVPSDIEDWLTQSRSFTAASHAPAVQQFLSTGTVPTGLLPQLQAQSGLPAAQWQAQFNLGPLRYRQNLLPGQLIGRYDGRMAAATGTPLAAEGDPSSTWIGSSFAQAINSYLNDTLRYRNASTYVLSSNAIQSWDFRHEGRPLPDTIPDLDAVLAANPRLRVLSIAGHHDLATPFHLTELDLARLGADPRVRVRSLPGGHMSFLDDATRVRQRTELIDFIAEAVAARGSAAPLAKALAVRPDAERADRAGRPVTEPQPALREPALQGPLCDPCVPDRRPLS